MIPVFETIVNHIPAPEGDPDADTQVLISTIDYNAFVGRIGLGKVENGGLKINQDCVLVNHHDPDKFKKIKIGKLYEFDCLKRAEVTSAGVGSIVAISGIADIHIGDTICSPENPEAIPFQKISFRNCGYPYWRYHLFSGKSGGNPLPEDFRAYDCNVLYGK